MMLFGELLGGAQSLVERMTFDNLMGLSDPKRITRSATVRVPPLKFDAYRDQEAYYFNVKSSPSTTGLRHKGYVRVFKPKNPNTPLERCECEVDCSCFAPSVKVLMGDGTYRRIADVKVGEFVYTHTGARRRVLNNRSFKPEKDVYKIDVTGFPEPLIATGDHPFYTLRGNEFCLCGCGEKLSNNLASPKYLVRSQFKQGHYHRGTKLEDHSRGIFQWVPVERLKRREWFLLPWMEGGTGSVDPRMARLLGYYAAEGCVAHKTKGREIRITLNQDEAETVAEDILWLCAELGYHTKLRGKTFRRKTGKLSRWIVVSVYSKEFRSFCVEHAGQGSHTKRLSPTVMGWRNDVLRELLTGIVLGDGWTDLGKGCVRYCSSSFDLISQVSTILNRMRIKHVVNRTAKKKKRDGYAHQVQISPGVGAQTVYSWLKPCLRDKDQGVLALPNDYGLDRAEGQLRRQRSVRKIEYTGLVHDLTVEGDESFIANGIAVHNCPDYKFRFAWVNKQRGSSQVGPRSFNQALNRAPRITNPKGRPGLCKHVIATRDYIYGQFRSFAGDQERTDTTVDKMDRLVKQMQKRWADHPGEVAKAKERDRKIRQSIERAAYLRANPSARPDAGVKPSELPTTSPEPIEPEEEEMSLDSATDPDREAREAAKAGFDSVAAWRAARSEESLVSPVVKTMTNQLVSEMDIIIHEQEEMEKRPGAGGGPDKSKLAGLDKATVGERGDAPGDDESEELKMLREIRDIVRHLAGDDLPPDLVKTEPPEVEPGIPVEASRASDQI